VAHRLVFGIRPSSTTNYADKRIYKRLILVKNPFISQIRCTYHCVVLIIVVGGTQLSIWYQLLSITKMVGETKVLPTNIGESWFLKYTERTSNP